MKRLILLILAILILIPALADAQEACRSAGLKTESAAILSRQGTFCGIEIITDGTNAATVTVYDNASTNSGTVLFKGTVAGANGFGGGFVYVPVSKGVYVLLSGTGANYIVYYK